MTLEERRAYQRAWRLRNRGKVRQRSARVRAADPEAARRYDRDYKREHYDSEAAAARNAEQYQRHGEERRARSARWRRDNPVAVARQQRRRRERLLGADQSDAPSAEYERVLYADPCAYCGGPSEVLDHVTPLAAGGDGNVGNLAGSCSTCNARKSAMPALIFLLRGAKMVDESRPRSLTCR